MAQVCDTFDPHGLKNDEINSFISLPRSSGKEIIQNLKAVLLESFLSLKYYHNVTKFSQCAISKKQNKTKKHFLSIILDKLYETISRNQAKSDRTREI